MRHDRNQTSDFPSKRARERSMPTVCNPPPPDLEKGMVAIKAHRFPAVNARHAAARGEIAQAPGAGSLLPASGPRPVLIVRCRFDPDQLSVLVRDVWERWLTLHPNARGPLGVYGVDRVFGTDQRSGVRTVKAVSIDHASLT
jgi:hypothetical protein